MGWIYRVVCGPAAGKGLALFSGELSTSASSSTALHTVASAVSISGIAYALSLKPCIALADALEEVDASDPVTISSISKIFGEVQNVLSVFHPKNLIIIFGRNMGIQVLMKFNMYMMKLLEHEKQSLEAEEQGRQAPPPPGMPDFKPCFEDGFWNSCKEVSVNTVRKIYEVVAIRKLGMERATVLLRDHRLWIRDVLAFKHRLDPLAIRFNKYLFTVLHSTALYFAADFTVGVILHVRKTCMGCKNPQQKIILIGKGTVAQAVRCAFRFASASVGAGLGSLIMPGLGTTLGYTVFDLGSFVASASFIDWVTEE